ncbi:MAG: hypothetical protein HZB29_09790 [Nitrospinae bacterium]|nr:hypothetical protein [Nitrospinota bacterium]
MGVNGHKRLTGAEVIAMFKRGEIKADIPWTDNVVITVVLPPPGELRKRLAAAKKMSEAAPVSIWKDLAGKSAPEIEDLFNERLLLQAAQDLALANAENKIYASYVEAAQDRRISDDGVARLYLSFIADTDYMDGFATQPQEAVVEFSTDLLVHLMDRNDNIRRLMIFAVNNIVAYNRTKSEAELGNLKGSPNTTSAGAAPPAKNALTSTGQTPPPPAEASEPSPQTAPNDSSSG